MVSVQLIKRSDRYNGIDGYESQLLTDFGFADYNMQNGADFPALPASDDGTTCFRITIFKKSKKSRVPDSNLYNKGRDCGAFGGVG